MTQNVYSKFFDRIVRVNVVHQEEDVIAMVKYGIYKDYNPNRNLYICGVPNNYREYVDGDELTYELHESSNDYSLCREDILFEKEDIYPFILRKIGEWYDETPARMDRVIQNQDKIANGGYLIRLTEDYDIGRISASIEYVYLNVGESYRNPYQIKSLNGRIIEEGQDLDALSCVK